MNGGVESGNRAAKALIKTLALHKRVFDRCGCVSRCR
jgi:hypothetical protein